MKHFWIFCSLYIGIFVLMYQIPLCGALITSPLVQQESLSIITDDGAPVKLIKCSVAQLLVNDCAGIDNHFAIAHQLLKKDTEQYRNQDVTCIEVYPNILQYCNFVEPNKIGHHRCMRNGIMLYALIKKIFTNQELVYPYYGSTVEHASQEWCSVLKDVCFLVQEHQNRLQKTPSNLLLHNDHDKIVLINEIDTMMRFSQQNQLGQKEWICCRDFVHTIFSGIFSCWRSCWRIFS